MADDDRSDAPVEPPSRRIAFEDPDFLARAELRPYRLALEYAKPQKLQLEAGVESTIVVFGSARAQPPERAREALVAAIREAAARPHDTGTQLQLRRARKDVELSRYYEEARRFGGLVSEYCKKCQPYDFVITTGGGPGIMEAANRGAAEQGRKTMGLNIQIPYEQAPNPYISPELCFEFHYFALRKMHFLLRARALVIFPGGFGTIDELFDALTLIQTGKMQRLPIIMFGREYWSRVLHFDAMVEAGTIAAEDLQLMIWAESADEAWKAIRDFWAVDGSVPPARS